jgi:2-polyprenyl-3-methyl-5-hydroxy-6-metoxy-1,4-benzoquinol methylase
MLNRLLPQSSPARKKLRFLARRVSVVPPRIRKNFSQPTPEGITQLREQLQKTYFPSWYSGVDMDKFYDSEEGQDDLDRHMTRRLEIDRYEFIPWIESVICLSNLNILEIGCGTGSATVARGEQGAKVIGLDAHREALAVAKLRAEAHGVSSVSFIEGNAADLKKLTQDHQFDLIVFFAVLEHMTIDERISALRSAWDILQNGKHLCITDTPNRLWFYDGHTSYLPFFNWLPDELALRYSKFSSRYPFNQRFRNADSKSMLSFIRDGRGLSFHEIDIAIDDEDRYKVVSNQTSFLSRRNPAKALKRLAARDGKREKLLNSYAPGRHRAFFMEYLNLVIKKLQ